MSPDLSSCALTHLDRVPIDCGLAAQQHAAYEQALARAGLTVLRLPELASHPDAVFVEDTALLLDEHAVITRPGADSRSGETETTAAALKAHFEILRLEAGHLDGGDVLRIGRRLYVGNSSRTDRNGFDALKEVGRRLGFEVVGVPLRKCLHLKTAATFAGADGGGTPVLLVNPAWVDLAIFSEVECLEVDKAEPAAANVLSVGDRLIVPAGNPRTTWKLEARGFRFEIVDISELEKAEAGVTCLSLISDINDVSAVFG